MWRGIEWCTATANDTSTLKALLEARLGHIFFIKLALIAFFLIH